MEFSKPEISVEITTQQIKAVGFRLIDISGGVYEFWNEPPTLTTKEANQIKLMLYPLNHISLSITN